MGKKRVFVVVDFEAFYFFFFGRSNLLIFVDPKKIENKKEKEKEFFLVADR